MTLAECDINGRIPRAGDQPSRESRLEPVVRVNDAIYWRPYNGRIDQVVAVTQNGRPIVQRTNFEKPDEWEVVGKYRRFLGFLWWRFIPNEGETLNGKGK